MFVPFGFRGSMPQDRPLLGLTLLFPDMGNQRFVIKSLGNQGIHTCHRAFALCHHNKFRTTCLVCHNVIIVYILHERAYLVPLMLRNFHFYCFHIPSFISYRIKQPLEVLPEPLFGFPPENVRHIVEKVCTCRILAAFNQGQFYIPDMVFQCHLYCLCYPSLSDAGVHVWP